MNERMNEWILCMVNIICNSYVQYNIIGFTIDWLYVHVCRTQLSTFNTLEICMLSGIHKFNAISRSLQFIQIIFRNSVPVSHTIYLVSATKNKQIISYRTVIYVSLRESSEMTKIIFFSEKRNYVPGYQDITYMFRLKIKLSSIFVHK
jgi:hypothetical protein